MTRMPNIELSPKDYKLMVDYCGFSGGGESSIYKSMRPDTLYKIFIDEQTGEPIGLSDNKLKKLLELYQRQLDNFVQPISTISLNGELIGYEMSYDKDDIILSQKVLRRRHLIEILKQTSAILHSLAEQDITYGDVKGNNILINKKTRQITFCDIDNMRIGEYPVDLLNDYAAEIVSSKEFVDERVDQYLHNLMTLQMLNASSCTYDDILYDLSEGHFRKYYTSEAQETLATMASPKPFKGGYIAPYIKK